MRISDWSSDVCSSDLEILLLKVLERRLRLVVGMARQMDLAVTADDAARLVDQHRGIEAAAVSGQFGIAEVEADAEFAGEIEQRLCLRARHAGLEEARDRPVVFHPVARGEGGEREFGKNQIGREHV